MFAPYRYREEPYEKKEGSVSRHWPDWLTETAIALAFVAAVFAVCYLVPLPILVTSDGHGGYVPLSSFVATDKNGVIHFQ